MVKATKLFLSTLLVLAIALSGCSGDDGGDGGGGETTTTTTTTMTGTMTSTGTTEPGTPGVSGPQYVNGTVSGALDCTLLSQGQSAAMSGASGEVPLGFQNGTYTVSVTEDELMVASLCIYFDGEAGTGTVPPTATTFVIYADQAPAGVGYSVEFLPPA